MIERAYVGDFLTFKCTEPHAEGKVWKITFFRPPSQGWEELQFSTPSRREEQDEHRRAQESKPERPPGEPFDFKEALAEFDLPADKPHGMQSLVGDTRLSGLSVAPNTRRRFDRRCELRLPFGRGRCPARIQVRWENLTPVLDELVTTGERDLTIPTLQAIVDLRAKLAKKDRGS